MTVLVVDNDEAFREYIANLLLTCGVEKIELTSNTEQALKKISIACFDIILVDLFMPDMNGLQFAQKCRKRMPKTRIILLIEDQQLPAVNNAAQSKLNFPTLLKSFVSRDLPQLLSVESNFNVSNDVKNFFLFSEML